MGSIPVGVTKIKKDGNYTEKEIEVFKSVVERGAPFFYETAREGGIQIA